MMHRNNRQALFHHNLSQLTASRCSYAPGKTPVTPIQDSRDLRLIAADGNAGIGVRTGVIRPSRLSPPPRPAWQWGIRGCGRGCHRSLVTGKLDVL